jgi:hypothetical protein
MQTNKDIEPVTEFTKYQIKEDKCRNNTSKFFPEAFLQVSFNNKIDVNNSYWVNLFTLYGNKKICCDTYEEALKMINDIKNFKQNINGSDVIETKIHKIE